MFVVVNSIEDEQVVINEGRSDIKPLNIDILDVSDDSVFALSLFILIIPPRLDGKCSNRNREIQRLHLYPHALLPRRAPPSSPSLRRNNPSRHGLSTWPRRNHPNRPLV